MPQPRRPVSRRRPRAPRLVDAPERGVALTDPEDWRLSPETLSGWGVGLITARYLRSYFPDFWAAHVAQKPLTTSRLLGVVHAFLELGAANLLAIDTGHACSLRLGVPADEIHELVDGYRDEGGILWELTYNLWHWIYQPPVEVYGLDMDVLRVEWGGGRHHLTLALLWMLRQTTWQQLGLSRSELLAVRGGRRIAALPNLHPDVPMDALADALDWCWPLDGIDLDSWTLGGLVRLVCSQTHNEFADVSSAEANEDMAWWCEGIYDEPHRLFYEREKQRGARQLRAAYDALDRRVSREPQLLEIIARSIVQAAERVTAAHQMGRTLIELTEVAGRLDAPVPTKEEICAV